MIPLAQGDDFWVMIIVVSAIWAFSSVTHRIVDAIVQTKEAKIKLQREYLAEMMADLEEIKTRLNLLQRETSQVP